MQDWVAVAAAAAAAVVAAAAAEQAGSSQERFASYSEPPRAESYLYGSVR